MLFPPMMFIILNIVFFGILLLFMVKASTGALVYEQVYAKQVALLIDEAKAEMQILVDFEEGVKVAEKNKKTSGLVRVDNKTNQVIVNLGSKEGYGYKYFSDYDVNVYDHSKKNLIIINIEEKVWEEADRPVDFDKEWEEAIVRSKNCGDYSEFIHKYAKEYGVDPILVLALIMHESVCKFDADNGADVGLMQINLEYHCGKHGLSLDVEKCREELKNPETNIKIGVEILKWSYDTYGPSSKTEVYKKAVEAKCKISSYQELYLSYEEWERALRAYNGFGCSPKYAEYLTKVEEEFKLLGGGELDVA